MTSPTPSYHTAQSSPTSSMDVDSASENPLQVSRHRPATLVSPQIASLCHIYFDEKLYHSALGLVTTLASCGSSHPDALTIPALAPLPIHIEAASILLVHPEYTTQAAQNERAELASRSISFLRSLLSNIGPLNAKFAEAFSFTPPRSRGRRRYAADDTSSSDDEEEISKLKGVIMNKGRIRTCATDFWHVVGWALNCSVVHLKRWKYWKIWLNYMLDVLDEDWNEREALDAADDTAKDSFEMRKKSMLVTYLSNVKGRSSALKRVVGSIFVDGGSEDLRAYPEVFTNETLELKSQNGHKRKRDDDFGNYSDDEETDFDFDSEAPAPSQETDDGNSAPDPWIGGPGSIKLRQRVLTLLSRVAYFLPDEFVDLRDLYNVYCDYLKSLPLPAFSLMMSPSAVSQVPTAVLVTLSQMFMIRILPNTSRPHSVSGRSDDALSQDILERCLLPFAANTSATDDNAKVSILAETLLRLYLKNTRASRSTDLTLAIETGIKAREAKCKSDKRRKDTGARRKEEEEDRKWLIGSGKRLRSLLNHVEQQSDSDEE